MPQRINQFILKGIGDSHRRFNPVKRRFITLTLLIIRVISSLYGWALEKAGHQVEFYVRSGSASKYGPILPLKLLDARKRFNGVSVEENWQITMREKFDATHDYDLIILSVQHYQFKEAVDFLSSRVGNATVLIFNNFWKDLLAEAAALPKEQLAWGFPKQAEVSVPTVP